MSGKFPYWIKRFISCFESFNNSLKVEPSKFISYHHFTVSQDIWELCTADVSCVSYRWSYVIIKRKENVASSSTRLYHPWPSQQYVYCAWVLQFSLTTGFGGQIIIRLVRWYFKDGEITLHCMYIYKTLTAFIHLLPNESYCNYHFFCCILNKNI